jgi:hypothetical protein
LVGFFVSGFSTGELFLKDGGGIGGGKMQLRRKAKKIRPPESAQQLNALVKRTSNLKIFTTVFIPTRGGFERE